MKAHPFLFSFRLSCGVRANILQWSLQTYLGSDNIYVRLLFCLFRLNMQM